MQEFKEYCGSGLPHPTNRPDCPSRDSVCISLPPSIETITPVILEAILNRNHKIGYSDHDGDEYEENHLYFDNDGWYAEITYRLCGKWMIETGDYWTPPSEEPVNVWGDVEEMTVTYHDCDTDDDIEFSEDELAGLRKSINEILKEIAY